MSEPPTSDTPGRGWLRSLPPMTWLSALATVVLIGGAVVLLVFAYPFFAVAAFVLGVFAAVEFAWLLRSTRSETAERPGKQGSPGRSEACD